MNAKLIAIIALFVAAVMGAVVFTLSEGGTEYRTFPELQADSYGGQRVRVKSQVTVIEQVGKPTTFLAVDLPPAEDAPKSDYARKRGSCRVIYEGSEIPQGFKEGCHATLEGRYDPKREAFIATSMQTQCPSKYEGKQTPELPKSEVSR